MNVFSKPALRLTLLALLFAAQWAVPVSQVIREEGIRSQGALFRLALVPVDPLDLMRGRYLALSFPADDAALPAPSGSKTGDAVYAVLRQGANGLADIARLSATPEKDAFATTITDIDQDKRASVRIPLTRFYLPESDAVHLDAILAGTNNAPQNVQVALDVRLQDGRMVAETLWLDGRPYHEWLADYLRNRAAKP